MVKTKTVYKIDKIDSVLAQLNRIHDGADVFTDVACCSISVISI